MTTTQEPTRRRLGSNEKRDWFAGLDARQISYALPVLFIILFEVYALGITGIVLMFPTIAVAAAVIYGRWNGEAIVDWLPHRLGHIWARINGFNTWHIDAASMGFVFSTADGKAKPIPIKLPKMIGDVSALAYQVRTGDIIGIGVDKGRTFTTSISLQFSDFVTRSFVDQDELLSKWGQILAKRANEGSPVSRISWIVRTIAEDPEAHAEYLKDNAHPDFWKDKRTAGYRRSMMRGSEAPEFEITVNVTIDRALAVRAVRKAGGGRIGACRVLEAEIEALSREIRVALGPTEIGWVLYDRFIDDMRLVYEPYERTNVLSLDGNGGPRRIEDILPTRLDNSDPHYVATGRSLHRVYHVKQYPNQDLPTDYAYDFLADRLGPKAICMVMELVPNSKASRDIMRAATNDVSVVNAHEEAGRRVARTKQKQAEQHDEFEDELMEGHRVVRFSMYATIAGRDLEELEDMSIELEALFADSSISIKPTTDQHGPCLRNFLPIGAGLKSKSILALT